MKRLVLGVLVAGAAFTAVPANAQPQLTLGTPTYGGTGCPQGTASAVLSADRTQLSILYDQWVTSVDASGGFDRDGCTLAVPVEVPQGISVSIYAVDYRGFNFLPPGGMSQFQVEYFFTGGIGPIFTQEFQGPLAETFLIRNELAIVDIVWSGCGEDVILRANASTFLRASEAAQISVDSEDIDTSIVFLLQTQTC
jgi:hypothetical protein